MHRRCKRRAAVKRDARRAHCEKIIGMKKLALFVPVFLITLSPLAHASVESGAHQFKEDVKSAGRQTGHAARDAAHAIGDGAKSAGHAIADTSKRGYHATKKWVTGEE
ncbi:hypothetical protein BTHE68_69950 (plasmid) [Burkholderia sp. THE68]|nr:hypothetical protein BTHE68_69950 [Burkholderia sp. THE68]